MVEGARSTCPLLLQLPHTCQVMYIYIYPPGDIGYVKISIYIKKIIRTQCVCTCMPSCVCNIQCMSPHSFVFRGPYQPVQVFTIYNGKA